MAQIDTTTQPKQEPIGEIYTIVEEMPRFSGCEELEGTIEEKKRCADGKLLSYFMNHWRIPPEAIERQVYERIVVTFVIDKKGKVRKVEILKDPGYGMGASVAKLLYGTNQLPQAWRPGYHKGQPVAVKYSLPIHYRLNY